MNTYFLIISNNNWWNEDKHGFGQLFNNLKGYSPAKRPNNVKHSSPTHLRPAPYLTSVPQHLRHTKIEPFTCTWLGIGDLQGDSLGICRDWLVTHGCKNCYFRVVTILTEKKTESPDTPNGSLKPGNLMESSDMSLELHFLKTIPQKF